MADKNTLKGDKGVYLIAPSFIAPKSELQASDSLYSAYGAQIKNGGIRPSKYPELLKVLPVGCLGFYCISDTHIIFVTSSGLFRYNSDYEPATYQFANYKPVTGVTHIDMLRYGDIVLIPGVYDQSAEITDDILYYNINTDESAPSIPPFKTVHPAIAQAIEVTVTTEAGTIGPGYYQVYTTLYNADTGAETYFIDSTTVLVTNKKNILVTVAYSDGSSGKLRVYRTLKSPSAMDARYGPAYLAYEGNVADGVITLSDPDDSLNTVNEYGGLFDIKEATKDFVNDEYPDHFFKDECSIREYGGNAFLIGVGNMVLVLGNTENIICNVPHIIDTESRPLALVRLNSAILVLCEDGLYKIKFIGDTPILQIVCSGDFTSRSEIASDISGEVCLIRTKNGISAFDGVQVRNIPVMSGVSDEGLWTTEYGAAAGTHTVIAGLPVDAVPNLYHGKYFSPAGSLAIYKFSDSEENTSVITFLTDCEDAFQVKFFESIALSFSKGSNNVTIYPAFSIDGTTYTAIGDITITSSNYMQPITMGIPQGCNSGRRLYIKLTVVYTSSDWLLRGLIMKYMPTGTWY